MPEKEVAYFTYLDNDHSTLFTKDAWAQYKTTDLEYIAYLTGIAR